MASDSNIHGNGVYRKFLATNVPLLTAANSLLYVVAIFQLVRVDCVRHVELIYLILNTILPIATTNIYKYYPLAYMYDILSWRRFLPTFKRFV